MFPSNFLSILLILLQCFPGSVLRCHDYTDCRTCVSHKTWNKEPCRWCPLDNKCHAKWSPKNHCKRGQNVLWRSQCSAYDGGKFNYNATEAYKLALFSAVAYSDEPEKCMRALFPLSDYTIVNVFRKNCDDYIFDYDKQCMAILVFSHRNKEVVLAFRGTRGIKQVVDQVLTTIGVPSVSSAIGGRVQHYFNNIHHKFYHSLQNLINDLKNWFPKYRVKITGHSLGGATASITSAMLVKNKILKSEDVSLYTFGMPRVGNKVFALAHDKLVPDSTRVVRRGDVVARLPVCGLAVSCAWTNGPYHHGNKVLYSGKTMRINSTYAVCSGNEANNRKCEDKIRKRRSVSSFLHRIRRSVVDLTLNKHKYYFGIPIGTYCRDHVLKRN